MIKTVASPRRRNIGLWTADLVGRTVRFLGKAFPGRSALMVPMAFLLGRTVLFSGIVPFGVPVYASVYESSGISRFLIAAAAIAGMVTRGFNEGVYVTAAGIFLFSALAIPFGNVRKGRKTRRAILAAVSVLIPGIVITGLQGFLLYDVLRTFLGCTAVFALTFIFYIAVPFIMGTNVKADDSHVKADDPHVKADGFQETAALRETASCAAVMAVLSIAGLDGFNILGISIKDILSILVVLAAGYGAGAGAGAAAGAAVGLMSAVPASSAASAIGAYAFCGMLSGVFRSLSKAGPCLGLIIGNMALTLYANGSTDVLIPIADIIAASLTFISVPGKHIKKIAAGFGGTGLYTDCGADNAKRLDWAAERLRKFSNAFRELSAALSKTSGTETAAGKQEITILFDNVAERVCRTCTLCPHCWDRNFCSTYQAMFRILEQLDFKGSVDRTDIPGYFLERCEHIDDFVRTVNSMYEVFRVDLSWKGRIAESRGIIARQMEGMSGLMDILADEMGKDGEFHEDKEEIVTEKLRSSGFDVHKTVIMRNYYGKYEVQLIHGKCGGLRKCSGVVEKAVSSVLGRKMKRESDECRSGRTAGMHTLKLIEEEKFGVTTGAVSRAAHGEPVSGDGSVFFYTADGRYVIALSDGMGTGKSAAVRSGLTVNLLEQLLDTGFERDVAVRFINSILALKADDDSFATIDLTVTDLCSGDSEFVKVGAAPTFIKRADRVEIVKQASLPAGVLDRVETELVHKTLEDGDIVIMMSDGVVDGFGGGQEGLDRLKRFINGLQCRNPQEVAAAVAENACGSCAEGPEDDVTVLAARLWRRF